MDTLTIHLIIVVVGTLATVATITEAIKSIFAYRALETTLCIRCKTEISAKRTGTKDREAEMEEAVDKINRK